MQHAITIVVTFLCSIINAQISVEKHYPLAKANNLVLELPYATSIEVNAVAADEIHLQAIVDIDHGKLNDHFELITRRQFSTLYVKSDYGELFENQKSILDLFFNINKGTEIKLNTNNDVDPLEVDGISIEVIYVLNIPQSVDVKLISNSGNVVINSMEGKLSVECMSGNIVVRDFNGDLGLKSVSGKIDFKIGKASALKVETTIGKIYKEEQIPNLVIGEKLVGSFANADFEKGVHVVRISTVSGDIHLRN